MDSAGGAQPQHETPAPSSEARRHFRTIGVLAVIGAVALTVAVVAANRRDATSAGPARETAVTFDPEAGLLPPPTEAVFAPATDFTVPTAGARGGRFGLFEHLAQDGRPVLLNLWASWCIPCRREMPTLDAAQRAHPGIHFIGVSVLDSRDDAEAFLDEIDLGYQIGFDEDGAVETAYPPLGMPETYLISTDGRIVKRLFGELTAERLERELEAAFGPGI